MQEPDFWWLKCSCVTVELLESEQTVTKKSMTQVQGEKLY